MANKEKQDEQERYENEVIQLHTVVGVLKGEKRKECEVEFNSDVKPVVLISENLYDKHKVVEVIERSEGLRDEVMRILEEFSKNGLF